MCVKLAKVAGLQAGMESKREGLVVHLGAVPRKCWGHGHLQKGKPLCFRGDVAACG
jgi:hypothetical protein